MSRLGKLPVEIPSGVTASVAAGVVSVKGPKGELTFSAPSSVRILQEDGALKVEPAENSKSAKAMYGTARARIKNMVAGVTKGFEKNLELVGVGYRAQMQGSDLKLALGFSHDVIYTPRKGITITVAKPTEIKIEGADAQAVGQTAAEIRRFRAPEPYKGKGVKYADEHVRRKEGKKK
ncbi:50S ribosomal protein L6 [Alkalicaulis satelles]|uniref:Large ribosomal subunit protein uL6 n=1 Tax=Alkalicaulis satelles TaxID=2609175 RepID=A0A5M6ZA24_9PROT|nr:50S ribosomal protein L6 [Alkalicaulis satelles]KAA5801536.1 50S ribosomal protein L6 [Alkalicaulis satelles]